MHTQVAARQILCPPPLFRKFKEQYPDHTVISYINCTAGIKALSDIICTSSNAVKIVETLPLIRPSYLLPDRNLGRYVMEKTGRDMVLWNGTCMVHEIFSQKDHKTEITGIRMQSSLRIRNEEAILEMADFMGSTTGY